MKSECQSGEGKLRAAWRRIARLSVLGPVLLGVQLPAIAPGAEACVLTLVDLSAKESGAGKLTLTARVGASEGCRVPEKGTAIVSWGARGSCPDMSFGYEPMQAFPAPEAGGEDTAVTVISTRDSGSCSFLAVLECYQFRDCRTEPPDGIKNWEGSHEFNR